MSESPNRRRLRFSLRSLLVITLLAAMLCWGGVTLYERRRYEANTMSLNLAIEGFNAIASADPIGSMEPKITEDEVLTAISSQVGGVTNPRAKSIFEQIARARRIPLTTRLRSGNEYGPAEHRHTVWFVYLDVQTSGPIPGTTQISSGYALPIRSNFHPKAAAANHGKNEPKSATEK